MQLPINNNDNNKQNSDRFDLFIDKHLSRYTSKQPNILNDDGNNYGDILVGDVDQVQKYSVEVMFLNPRYVTE